MRIASTRGLCGTLFVCLFLGLGLTISGCDSGGANSGESSGNSPDNDPESYSTANVDEVGSTAKMELAGSSKSKASSTRGIVTVLFFYGKNSDNSICFASTSAEITLGKAKKVSPDPPRCADGPKKGFSVKFTVLSGSASDLTLELQGEDGEIVASASPSDGELTLEGGEVPGEEGSADENSSAEPAWVGTWVATSVNGRQMPQQAYKITESRWTIVARNPNTGRCNSYIEPIAERNSDANTITLLGEDGRTLEFEVSVSNATLTAETVRARPNVEITADTTPKSPKEAINCTIDTNPPPSPSGLTSTGGDGYVSLSWDEVTSEPARYYVYRSTAPISDVSDRTPLGPPVPGTQFVDTSATNGTTYHYAITAVDRSLNESSASRSVSASPVESTSERSFEWTGDWKVTSIYDASEGTRSTPNSLYYSISEDQFVSYSQRTSGDVCDVTKSPITSVIGDRVTFGTGAVTASAIYDVSNGMLTISVVSPPDIEGDQLTATPVSSDPREILGCSSVSKNDGQAASSVPLGF